MPELPVGLLGFTSVDAIGHQTSSLTGNAKKTLPVSAGGGCHAKEFNHCRVPYQWYRSHREPEMTHLQEFPLIVRCETPFPPSDIHFQASCHAYL